MTNNKIFRKREKSIDSIYCSKNTGPWFPYIGFYEHNGRKNLSEGQMIFKKSEIYFEDAYEIIPNISKTKKDTFFNAEEVEVYKILFI